MVTSERVVYSAIHREDVLKIYNIQIINLLCGLFNRVREGPELNKDRKPAPAPAAAALNEAKLCVDSATFVCFVIHHS